MNGVMRVMILQNVPTKIELFFSLEHQIDSGNSSFYNLEKYYVNMYDGSLRGCRHTYLFESRRQKNLF